MEKWKIISEGICKTEEYIAQMELQTKLETEKMKILTDQIDTLKCEKQTSERILKRLEIINGNLKKALSNKNDIHKQNVELGKKITLLRNDYSDLKRKMEQAEKDHSEELEKLKDEITNQNTSHQSIVQQKHEEKLEQYKNDMEILETTIANQKEIMKSQESDSYQQISELKLSYGNQILELQKKIVQLEGQSCGPNCGQSIFKKKLQHQQIQYQNKIHELEAQLSRYRYQTMNSDKIVHPSTNAASIHVPSNESNQVLTDDMQDIFKTSSIKPYTQNFEVKKRKLFSPNNDIFD